jgi:hypothetical protein
MASNPVTTDPATNDILPFLAGVTLLVLYLWWSAATEMGTRWPWRK